MITRSSRGHLLVEIGQGDINVDFGVDGQDKVAYLAMREQAESVAAPEMQIFDGQVYANALDYPLIISFATVEGVDAVIRALQRCRKALADMEEG